MTMLLALALAAAPSLEWQQSAAMKARVQAKCEEGSQSARASLALALTMGAGVEIDVPRALALAAKACDGGNGAGCALTAHVLGSGLAGRAKDPSASAAYSERACLAEHAPDATACFLRAGDYWLGIHRAKKDSARAAELYQRA